MKKWRHLICMEINGIIIMFHSSGFKSARQPVWQLISWAVLCSVSKQNVICESGVKQPFFCACTSTELVCEAGENSWAPAKPFLIAPLSLKTKKPSCVASTERQAKIYYQLQENAGISILLLTSKDHACNVLCWW